MAENKSESSEYNENIFKKIWPTRGPRHAILHFSDDTVRGTVFEPPGGFYKNRILTKICFKPTLNPSKAIQYHVKLSFLSAALDPQEMTLRYWSYEGFMPIFWFGLIIWMCKFLGF